MTSELTEEKKPTGLSRREFLKASRFIPPFAVGLSGGLRGRKTLFDVLPSSTPEANIINGVEVYGNRGAIGSIEEYDNILGEINKRYLDSLPWHARVGENWQMREAIYGINQYALELIVRESDYRQLSEATFILRQQRAAELHTFLLKQYGGEDAPSIFLRRIIVVSDEIKSHPAYRWVDVENQLGSFIPSLDVDHSEYIGDEVEKGEGSYLWTVSEKDGELRIAHLTGTNYFDDNEYRFSYPSKGYLSGSQSEIYDTYQHHERMHRLLNVPDLYHANLRRTDRDIVVHRNMRFEYGKWAIPEFDPVTIAYAKHQMRRGVRGCYEHQDGILVTWDGITELYKQTPGRVRITIPGSKNIKVFSTMNGGGYNDLASNETNRRRVDTTNFQETSGDLIELDIAKLSRPRKFFEQKPIVRGVQQNLPRGVNILPTTYVITGEIGSEKWAVNFPVAIMNLSKLTGKLDSVKYEIKYVGEKGGGDQETLSMSIVKKSDLDTKMTYLRSRGGSIYALMDIGGTEMTCLWYHYAIRQENDAINIGVKDTPGKPNPYEGEEGN